MDTESTACKHQEVLIRLKDSENGEIIPPGAFIPAAERYNLMPQIDEWVVRTVIQMMDSTGESNYTINLSGQSMGDEKFTQRMLKLLETSDIDRTRLCFEITETSAIANSQDGKPP